MAKIISDTLSAANQAFTASLSNESAARQAADTTLQTTITGESAARKQGDADTLKAATSYTDSILAAEAAARKQGDADTLNAATTYTDSTVVNGRYTVVLRLCGQPAPRGLPGEQGSVLPV